MPQLFQLGTVVATPGALALLERANENAAPLLARHQSGDWGDLSSEDREENDLSVREGHRILSSYKVDGEKIWIITERDRSSTTLLLPDEY